ncbi:MAG TPA: alpha/beta hydrolase family protein [Longimicrobium sp.]|uniref:alpha/beta hydrolase n=1 Tax=Longimicrobium sp. TaxID=2029185 RepID=UPI002EDBB63A
MPALRALRQPRLMAALFAALAAGLPGAAHAQAAAASDTSRVRIVSIPGSLPEPRNAVVVLPAGYHDSPRRYPVLYLLHGHDGGHRNWLDRTNLLAHTARLPLIVVLPDAANSWYTNSAARPAERFEEYVAREVPAFIDQHFRTLTYREARYVAGLSMGGYGALKLGLKHSARFSLAGSFSGAPLAAAGDASSQTRMDAFGPAGSASRAENDLLALARDARVADGTYFYLDTGTLDRLLADNRAFVQAMAARPLAYEYHEVPGTHSWEFWDRRLPVFLKLVEERIARLPAAEPIGVRTGSAPAGGHGTAH